MKVSVIVPCYNEEKRLDLKQFKEYSQKNDNIKFLFVNDGSIDKTAEILREFCETQPNFSFLDLKRNQGKAEAIRQGVLSLQEDNIYDFIGYFDADLATPLIEINHLLEQSQTKQKVLFIMGSRFSRMGAQINRKASRHYFGRIFATFVSIILKIPVYDTQCGLKLIHKKVVRQLFQEPFITKWMFDVELIARLENLIGLNNCKDTILEIPLNKWNDVAGSKLKFIDFLKAPIELFKIWRTY